MGKYLEYPVDCVYCEKEFNATDCVEFGEDEPIDVTCPYCDKKQQVYYTISMNWYSVEKE